MAKVDGKVEILKAVSVSGLQRDSRAKHIMSDGPALVFQLPRRMAKDGINAVKITLDPSDTYTMRFSKITDATLRHPYKATTVREVSDVYADQLREIFESTTGLVTSMGTLGRRSGDRRKSRGAKRSSRGKSRGSRRSSRRSR